MTIRFRIRHRRRSDEQTEMRHNIAIATLRQAADLTKHEVGDSQCILQIDTGDESESGMADLSPICVDGVRAAASYGPRFGDIPDVAMYDDSLVIVVDPEKVDYSRLVITSFATMVYAFGAYRAQTVLNRELDHEDHDRAVKLHRTWQSDIDGRDGVLRIGPVNFFDRELCQRAFNMSAERIAEALQGQVERVETLDDGVLLIVTSKVISKLEIEHIDTRIRQLMGVSTVI